MAKRYDNDPPIEIEPMKKWEKLVLEHHQLLQDKENDTSARRREIHKELMEKHNQYRSENPQFFGRGSRDHDDEFER